MLSFSPDCRSATNDALVMQTAIAALFTLLPDGGRLATLGARVIAGFSLGALVIILRRPRPMHSLDLWFFRLGYPMLLRAGVGIAARSCW